MLSNKEESAWISREVSAMHENASKYLVVETAMSALSNAILNFAAAYAIFHRRGRVPATGPKSLLMDLIGETFLVVALSMLVPWLIARHRRRAGTLPLLSNNGHVPKGNIYVRSIVVGLIFTCILVPCNALLLPRMFPNGVSFGSVLLFKTLYGTVFGAFATWLSLRRALNEAD